MFGFGLIEMLLLGGLFVLLFGLKRAPRAARELGRIHGTVQRIKSLVRNPFRFF